MDIFGSLLLLGLQIGREFLTLSDQLDVSLLISMDNLGFVLDFILHWIYWPDQVGLFLVQKLSVEFKGVNLGHSLVKLIIAIIETLPIFDCLVDLVDVGL